MKLSVIIVNYNVRHFLEQCLLSVARAMHGMEAEVFVVDNNSVDGSVEMILEKFPWVTCIANKENHGFSRANNQAISRSSGEYVLLLNPDTVVEEDTFSRCIDFMDAHPDAGALGVQMIDGKGNFLPESKRSLPNPSVAFYKIFGLSWLFPKSKTFGKYHLGYLDKNKLHEVEVLSGAFMMIRKQTLLQTGLLDETFFMYGEDIDLSYRIIKAGYKNYYFPETRIIHYKGESTRKSSVNYVIVFYKAMIIFARKHFSESNAQIFSFFISIAIYMRAGLAILNRFFKRIFLPICDAILFFAGMYALKLYWESSVKELHYPSVFMKAVVPAYILVWITSIFLSGGYDKPIRINKTIRGILTGTVFILVVYALLSEEYRFSRALILLGTAWACLSSSVLRIVLDMAGIKGYKLEKSERKNLIIVARPEEGRRVLSILQLSGSQVSFIGFVSPVESPAGNDPEYNKYKLGGLRNLQEISELYNVNEIIFCARDLSSQEIIDKMLTLSQLDIEYKIAPPESGFIIGSNSIDDQGDLYLVDVNAISTRYNKRSKRILDIVLSLVLLLFSPVLAFIVGDFMSFLSNLWSVIVGKLSWVGFRLTGEFANSKSAGNYKIRKGVLTPGDGLINSRTDDLTINRLNILYARDYNPRKDLKIVLRSLKLLGRKMTG